jgi:hypothetical protein
MAVVVQARACSNGARPCSFHVSSVPPRLPLRRSLVTTFKRDIALRAEGPKIAGPGGYPSPVQLCEEVRPKSFLPKQRSVTVKQYQERGNMVEWGLGRSCCTEPAHTDLGLQVSLV